MERIGIDTRLTYYRRGGIAEYMTQLTHALAQLDSPHTYSILHHYRNLENLTPAPHFQRVNCYTPCHHRYEAWALGVELLPRRLSLLHSPDFIPPRFGASHYVVTIHDLAFLIYPHIQTEESLAYYAGQIGRATRQADHIIAVSHTTKADIIRLLNVPEQKISVIWEGLHPQFKPVDPQVPPIATYPLPQDYILFVGTIEPRKNLPTTLQGYALLKDRMKGKLPRLVLAGSEGWLAEESFQAILDLKLGDDVIWLGTVGFADLPYLYSRAKVHLLTSLYEGFGFPPLEAMACGTPTVISDRGSLREIGGDAALYADPDDPESIAEQLYLLLMDDGLAQLQRQKGLAHVGQFTWEAAAHQTLAVYQQVLG